MFNLGLADPTDITLSSWNASIIGPQGTTVADRFFSLTLKADKSYPDSPPKVQFKTKINLPTCVKRNGEVDIKKIVKWSRKNCSMITILCGIRDHMKYCGKYTQPQEGETY